ncbi:MAG: EAL domain-containing protein [Epsilonproteobacteria bacterium]|nr:EAL domain-containing protein [Campylobacterota bacterium]
MHCHNVSLSTHQIDDLDKCIDLMDNIGGNVVSFKITLNSKPKIENISSNIVEVLGYSQEELLDQKYTLETLIYQKDIKYIYITVYQALFARKRQQQLSCRILAKDNTVKYITIHFLTYREKQTQKLHMIGYMSDDTEKKSYKEKVDYLSYYDTLTGLGNRAYIKKEIQKDIESIISSHSASALLFLNLNRFKNVNDTLGHKIGNRLLKHVSHRLRSCIKEDDTLARIGGDEFVILLSRLNQKTLRTHVDIIAKRVYNILERPFSIDSNLLHTTTSIGVAIVGIDGNSADELLKNADTAMSLAKKDQNHYLRYYQSTMQENAATHLEVENDIRVALKEEQFELYYQPQVDIKSDQITGAEALIRWRHPEKGIISPLKFIPIAEETGLIIPISEWVLKTACQYIKELEKDENVPSSFHKISINISSKQFKQPTFTADVKRIIKQSGINPASLELEVTEGALINDLDDAIEKMLILKELGIQFALDDFGTGYSSLTYLKKLPIDIIKIDKSFIMNMHTDNDDKILTQTIIQMSQNLNLSIIAEGVEKIEHLNFLQERGCDTYQGYFFSKPLTLKAFKRLLLLTKQQPLHLLRDTAQA